MPRSLFRSGIPATLVFAAALLLPGPRAWALDPKLKITQFSHDAWQQRDGLPSSVVQAIAQTPDGYLWLGTPAGLVRFDGATFTDVPTDPADPQRREYVYCLTTSPTGELWIGTRFSGVRRLVNGKVLKVALPGIDQVIRSLAFDNEGRLHIATGTALYQLLPDGQLRQRPSRQTFIQSLSRDGAGRVWIGYSDAAELAGAGDRPDRAMINDVTAVNAVAGTDAATTWIGTDSQLLRAQGGKFVTWTAGTGGTYQRVFALCADSDGAMWVGTHDGLSRVAPGAAASVAPEILRIGTVNALYADHEGSLWIGTLNGLHRLKAGKVTPWGVPEGLASDHTPGIVAGAEGSVYVLTTVPSGVCQLSGDRMDTFSSIIDGPAYVARDGVLWIGTTGMLSRLRGGKVDRFSTDDGLDHNWISALAEDDQPGLLMSFSQLVGLRRWDGHHIARYRLRDGSEYTVPFHLMSMYSAPDHTIWAAGYDGIWHLDHGEITRYVNAEGEAAQHEWYQQHPQSPRFVHTVVSEGMSDFWFSAVADDGHGTLWFASQRGGLTRFRNGKPAAMTTRLGLPTNQLYSVLIDGFGYLWMGTPGGILRVRASDVDAAINHGVRPHCELLTHHDGLRNDECEDSYQPAAARGADGRLWFATKSGVVSIDPASLRRNLVPPPVHVESVLVDGHEVAAQPELSLPPSSQKFEFHYTALSLLVPERVRFKYQLIGYDRDWIDAGSARVTQYTRLPPGRYRFQVQACNNDEVWNETGASFSFTLRPHYYETFWFYGICALGICLLGYGLHQWRVQGLKQREALLQARVLERTAELSRINGELKVEISHREKAQQQVERIHRELLTASHQAGMAQVATGVLHNVGNILNSVNVSTEMLATTLRQSKLRNLERVVHMLREHPGDLGTFLTADPKGRQIPAYLEQAAALAVAEEGSLEREVNELRGNVEHIRQIVAMQQQYAKVGGVVEPAMPAEIMEDALRINAGALLRHQVQVIREYDIHTPTITVEKHKVLQILVNCIQNAKYACDAAARPEKMIRLCVRPAAAGVSFAVVDNGVGIPAERLGMIFTYGFTTRKDGHGFGLHTGVLAAREMGGDLSVHSAGHLQGATFELILPLAPPEPGTSRPAAPPVADLAQSGAS